MKEGLEIVLKMRDVIASNRDRNHVLEKLSEYWNKVMRTLAFASQYETEGKWSPLTFDVIVDITHPVRGVVKNTITDYAQKAGVRVVILIGDIQGSAR